MQFSTDRRTLKRMALAASVLYFVLAILIVTLEKINGSPPAPYNPGMLPLTVLAVIGIVWGLRRDKPKGN